MSTESGSPPASTAEQVTAVLLNEDVAEYRQIMGGGGHAEKFGVVMTSGIVAIAKPSQDEQSRRQANNEEAAWLIARALGLEHLVGVTVQRELKNTQGRQVKAALQQWWGDGESLPAISDFADDVVFEAAVFDHLIWNQDRGQNNWMSTDDGGVKKLRLFDHGHAFGFPGGPRNSSWADAKAGQTIPDSLLNRVRTVAEDEELRERLRARADRCAMRVSLSGCR